MWGLTVDEASETIDIWPDNLQSLNVFASMMTQWRRAGHTGVCVALDYNVLPEMWRRNKVPPTERDDVFHDIRIMESEAIAQMRRNRKE